MWFRKQEALKQPEPTIDYDWLREITRNGHTPDIADLNNRQGAVVFVYNDLMRRHKAHHILNPIVYGGDAYTLEDCNGWYRRADRMPILLPPFLKTKKEVWSRQTAAHAAPFKGELHVVSISTLKELDKYHTNGVEFVRKRIEVHVPYSEDILTETGEKSTGTGQYQGYVKAWCYIGNPDYFWDGPHGINNFEYEPMPIWTPKNLNIPWKHSYYYHPFKETNGKHPD